MAAHTPNEGIDFAPIKKKTDRPDNLTFMTGNVVEGLSLPSSSFDLIHCRFLILGVSRELASGFDIFIGQGLGSCHKRDPSTPQT